MTEVISSSSLTSGYKYAVKGVPLPAGDSPARQELLQPVAIGAVVGARKLLKSSMQRRRETFCEHAGRNASER
jgi:hypothetical protein